MKKLSIKQKQEIYEYLLKKDCPDLLAALVAERSTSTLQHQFENNRSDFDLELSSLIMEAFVWADSIEGHGFWSELRLEIFDTETPPQESQDTEQPIVDLEYKPLTADPEYKISTQELPKPLVIPQPEKDGQSFKEWWAKVKLFFGKWNYKV